MERKNLGRQKVEMVKMTKESNLQVTFSKRRGGLFKKASELSTLCGVELALIVFSPGKKVYSFGHPSVDTVIDRYLSCNTQDNSITSQLIEAHRESNVRQLNMELTQVTNELEAKRKLGEELHRMNKANQQQYWFWSPIKELDLSQLQQLKSALEKLKKDVEMEKLAILNANSQQFFMGSSSGQGMIPNFMTNNNNIAFDSNMMDGGYMVPPAGYNLNPAQGYNNLNPGQYNFNLAEGYNVNPQEYSVNPIPAGYNINPVQGYDISPAEGFNANPQGNDILHTPGFGGGYNGNPQENDILQTPVFGGGYNAIPPENDILLTPGFGGEYNGNPQENDIINLLGFGDELF
ncbi:hypothetical protein HRI_002463100 [Hibiscus trionum]|uniref:MADS-box domain-containing protein n=1 Tax=Hibiscus trionum TaxID=183268 RepID=A0A9W7I4G2_HIBTR|nr:hypothetical protein HRI_002463100 [Hibiscus trionum]